MFNQTTKAMIETALRCDSEITREESDAIRRVINGAPEKCKLLKTGEACDILGVCSRTLFSYVAAGKIHAIKQSKRKIRFRASEIEALAYKGMQAAGE